MFSSLDIPNGVVNNAVLSSNIMNALSMLKRGENVYHILPCKLGIAFAQPIHDLQSLNRIFQTAVLTSRKRARGSTMTYIFSTRYPFQVFWTVVKPIRVFVVNFFAWWSRTMKCLTDQSVDTDSPVLFGRCSYLNDKISTSLAFEGFQNFADGGALSRRNSSYSSQTRNFISALKQFCSFPDLFLHRRRIL